VTLRFDDAIKFSAFCQTVVESNLGIIFAGFINKKGRIIELKARDSFSALDQKEFEMLCMQRALQIRMNKDTDDKLGNFICTVTKRKNLFEYITYMDEIILLVVMNSTSQIHEVIEVTDNLYRRFIDSFKLDTIMA
jgi:hypothetical protein